jgi:hypothetical protein
VVHRKQITNKSSFKKSTSVQSVLLSKEKFFTPEAAQLWLMLNGFNTDLDETTWYYRARQVNPSKFYPDTFRTISFSDRVKAVIGVRKGK